MKKILTLLLSMVCVLLCMVACNFGGKTSSTQSEMEGEVGIFFTEDAISLELYEDKSLSLQGTNGKAIAWRSTNPERIFVDENGKVTALMVGTATIYAKVDGKDYTCQVTVRSNGLIPRVMLNLPDNAIRIMEGDTFVLKPYVNYNGVEYFDASYAFTANGCVTISDAGVITAVSVGVGSVTITASWRGAVCETLTTVLEIEVVSV